MSHTASFRVYYEDTDAAGIVYYANYLKFAERARTEWLRTLGFSQSVWFKETGVGIVVTRCTVDYLQPARLDDELSVETRLREIGKVRMTMQQVIRRNSDELARLSVALACITQSGKPTRWPVELMNALTPAQE